jgi:glycosyltransferase involved in cell wall biosynthesis
MSLRVSVLIPVYNEEATLEALIDKVRAVPMDRELICVNDGSRDGSAAILERLLSEGKIDQLFHQPRNCGKGAAIRKAIELAQGDVLVVQDADLEYDPTEIPTLLQPIASGRADAVFGSRFMGGPHRVLYYWHSVGNSLLTWVSNMCTDLNLTDMETCYKVIRTPLAKKLILTTNRFGFEPEVTARLAQARARIWELPISYSGRTYEEGKKIGWRDGVAAFWHILRFNLLPPKNPAVRRKHRATHP